MTESRKKFLRTASLCMTTCSEFSIMSMFDPLSLARQGTDPKYLGTRNRLGRTNRRAASLLLVEMDQLNTDLCGLNTTDLASKWKYESEFSPVVPWFDVTVNGPIYIEQWLLYSGLSTTFDVIEPGLHHRVWRLVPKWTETCWGRTLEVSTRKLQNCLPEDLGNTTLPWYALLKLVQFVDKHGVQSLRGKNCTITFAILLRQPITSLRPFCIWLFVLF